MVEERAFEPDVTAPRMKWLCWPPFTVESISFLLACTVKDHIFLYREGVLKEEVGLINLIK